MLEITIRQERQILQVKVVSLHDLDDLGRPGVIRQESLKDLFLKSLAIVLEKWIRKIFAHCFIFLCEFVIYD
jgi:hypothetical protein